MAVRSRFTQTLDPQLSELGPSETQDMGYAPRAGTVYVIGDPAAVQETVGVAVAAAEAAAAAAEASRLASEAAAVEGVGIVDATINPVTGRVTFVLSSGGTLTPTTPITIGKAAYTIDLTDPSVLIVDRVGKALAQTGENTAAIVNDNEPIIETMDGWRGTWTHALIVNNVTANFSSGWADFNSPVVLTGQSDPTGASGAIRITDANAAAVCSRYSFASSYSAYVWARNSPADLPTVPGCVTAALNAGNADITLPVTGTQWKRYELLSGDGSGFANVIQLFPAGAAAPSSFNNAAVGTADYFFPFSTTSLSGHVGPAVETSVPAAGLRLTPEAVETLVTDGTFDITLEIVPSWSHGSMGIKGTTIWSANGGQIGRAHV